ERQPYQHARRVVAYRHVQEVAQLAELGDLIDLRLERLGRLPLQVAAVADVLPAVGVRLEPQGDVEQRADPASDGAGAGGGWVDAGDQLQERALAGTVVADHAQPVAVAQVQVDPFQGADFDPGVDRGAEQATDEKLLEGDPARLPDAELQGGTV